MNLVGWKAGSIDTRAEVLQSSHDGATHVTLHDVHSVLQRAHRLTATCDPNFLG
jgi:hypothetical protein